MTSTIKGIKFRLYWSNAQFTSLHVQKDIYALSDGNGPKPMFPCFETYENMLQYFLPM